MKRIFLTISVSIMAVALTTAFSGQTLAKVTGRCDNCHTMHNSQAGSVMATYGADSMPWKGTGPYAVLPATPGKMMHHRAPRCPPQLKKLFSQTLFPVFDFLAGPLKILVGDIIIRV